jgi:hypothetical protein
MIFGDEGGVKFRQDRNLLDDILNFILGIFDVNDFDGYRLACALIDAELVVRGLANNRDDQLLCKSKTGLGVPFINLAKAATTYPE